MLFWKSNYIVDVLKSADGEYVEYKSDSGELVGEFGLGSSKNVTFR
jgi:hypothetical protein